MSPCKITTTILSLAMVAALAAPASASYVERSIRAVIADPPRPVEQASQGDMSPEACWRDPDAVSIDPATGMRNCEAASKARSGDGRLWWAGPRAATGTLAELSPEACWRQPDDVLVNPATGRRACED